METGKYGSMTYHLDLDDDGHIAWPPRNKNTGKALQLPSQLVWQAVLVALRETGTIEDESGQASQVLFSKTRHWYRKLHHANMTKPTVKSFYSSVVLTMVNTGLVHREGTTKRTRSLGLAIDADQLPVAWQPSENGQASEQATSQPTEAAADDSASTGTLVPASTEAHTEGLPTSALELQPVDYNALATAMLQKVVEVCTAEPEAPGYDRSIALSVQLEHTHKQLDTALHRVRVLERDLAVAQGLVKSARLDAAEEARLRAGVEANMTQVVTELRRLGVAAYSLDDEQRAAIDRLMRSLPVGVNGADHD